MRGPTRFVLLLCLLVCGGCGKKKSTDDLIADLKSSEEKDRIIAVRLLPQRKGDATPQIVPALTEALKDKHGDVRWSAAIGLGSFGEQAKDAIPALQAAQRDRDARVREAAGVALSRIDPTRFHAPSKARPARGK
jgi:HEAT repeat protein